MSTKPQVKPATVKSVKVEGLVLMKIIKHCRENTTPVFGQLIGMEVHSPEQREHIAKIQQDQPEDGDDDNTTQTPVLPAEDSLEVIGCFPESDSGHVFQYDYVSAIRDTYHDGNVVGLYSSDYFGEYYDAELISIFYDYQLNFPNSVLIVFDPIRTQKGFISLRALRLSQAYLDLHSNSTTFTQAEFQKYGLTDPSKIFEEVPLCIHNSHLGHTYMLSLADSFPFIGSVGDRLNILTNDLPTTMVERLSTGGGLLDQFGNEVEHHGKGMAHASKQRAEVLKRIEMLQSENQRRKGRGLSSIPEPEQNQLNSIQDPSYLDNMLLAGRISMLSKDLQNLSLQSYKRHYLFRSITKPKLEEIKKTF